MRHQRQSYHWVMNKFLVLFVSLLAFLSHSKIASANHEAIELLLANGPMLLSSQPSCEPYQLAENPRIDSITLSQDVAWVLADMTGRFIESESTCEVTQGAQKLCRVFFSISEGELEWARIYQFETALGKGSGKQIKNLTCFNMP